MIPWWCAYGVGDCSGNIVGPYRSERLARRVATELNNEAKGDGWFEVKQLQKPDPIKKFLQTRKVRWFS